MSQEFETYYDVLGVPEDATAAHIKAAYRKRQFEFHPDRGAIDPDGMLPKANEAYAVLKDAEKRKRYNQLLLKFRAKQRAQRQAPPPTSGSQSAANGSTAQPPRPRQARPGPANAAPPPQASPTASSQHTSVGDRINEWFDRLPGPLAFVLQQSAAMGVSSALYVGSRWLQGQVNPLSLVWWLAGAVRVVSFPYYAVWRVVEFASITLFKIGGELLKVLYGMIVEILRIIVEIVKYFIEHPW